MGRMPELWLQSGENRCGSACGWSIAERTGIRSTVRWTPRFNVPA
jgi:hypothetical protein